MPRTPGSWTVKWFDDIRDDVVFQYPQVFAGPDMVASVGARTEGCKPGELNDNANLIAAAPDLLKACKGLVAVLMDCPGTFNYDPAVEDAAAAAIAKAEGA